MSASRRDYFELSAAARFESWAEFKVGLCLSLTNDLSFRVFDALITGQIPIVPINTFDLDKVISKKIQEELPIVRVGEITVENIRTAWQTAVERFNTDGFDGVMRRHLYALENHHVSTRIGELMLSLRDIAHRSLEWRSTDEGVGLFASAAEKSALGAHYPLLRFFSPLARQLRA